MKNTNRVYVSVDKDQLEAWRRVLKNGSEPVVTFDKDRMKMALEAQQISAVACASVMEAVAGILEP